MNPRKLSRRGLAAAGLATLGVVAASGVAYAYWTASAPNVPVHAAADSVNAGSTPTVSVDGTTVTLGWTAVTTQGGRPVTGYLLKRYDAPSGGAAVAAAQGTCAATVGALSCAETGVPDGTWYYTTTPVLGAWLGAESARSAPVTVVSDAVVPTVTSIVRAGASPNNGATVSWTVTFSEPVTGVDVTDFVLAATGVPGAAISSVTPVDPSTYTVTAGTGGGSGEGTLGLNLVDDDSIADLAGNSLGGPGVNGSAGGGTYVIDRQAPAVAGITRAGSSPTNAGSVAWNVVFTEDVSGVNGADFSLAKTGTVATGALTVTPTSDSSYKVTAGSVTGDGDLTLSLVDDDSIADLAGNALGGAGTGNGNFAGQTYAVDRTAPVTGDDAPAGWTNATSVTVTLSASDAGGSGVANTYYTTDGSDPRTSPTRTAGTAAVVSAAGTTSVRYASVDAAGNVEAVRTAQVRIDRQAPTTTDNAPASPTNAASVTVTLTPSDLGGSGVAQTWYTTDGTDPKTSGTRAAGTTVTLTAAGTHTIRYYSLDAAGNAGAVSSASVTIDRTAPTLTSLQMFDTDFNGKVDRVTATFSESLASSTATAPWALTGVPGGGSLASVSVSGATATLALTEGATQATGVESFRVALAQSAAGIRDAAGNRASFSDQAPADKAAPVPVSVTAGGNSNGAVQSGETLVVTFSEAIAPATVNTTANAATLTFSQANSANVMVAIAGLMATSDTGVAKGSWVKNNSTVTYRGTLSVSGTQITFTAGTLLAGSNDAITGAAGVLVFTPDAGLRDSSANAATGTRSTSSITLF